MLGAFPVLRFLIPLIIGIVCGHFFASSLLEISTWLWVATGILVAGIILQTIIFKRLVRNALFFLTTVLFFVMLGISLTVSAERRAVFPWSDQKAVYSGTVVSSPKPGEKVVRLRLKIIGEYREGKLKPIKRFAEISVMRSNTTETLSLGDAVMFYARINPPENTGNPFCFDYASYLKMHGVCGTAFVFTDDFRKQNSCQAEIMRNENLGMREKISILAERVRHNLLQIYADAKISDDELAALSAMTLGEKNLLSKSTREVFSDAGVSHILALSGLHLGIIYSLLQFLLTFGGRLRRMRIPAQILILLFIWTFVFVAGIPQSLLRAAVMYSVVSLDIMLRRNSISLGNLYFAAFVILLFSPFSLFDIGFQLSFVSVFCIIKFVRTIAPARTMSTFAGKIWGLVAVSLCAQIGVAPLIAYYFHNFPTYFILSNLVAVPLTSCIVACGFALLAFSWIPFLASAIATALEFILSCLQGFLAMVSAMPYASLTFFPSLATVILLYVALFFLVLAINHSKRIYLYPALSVVFMAIATETYSNRKEKEVSGVYCYKGISATAVHFMVSPEESYVYSPSETSDSLLWRATNGISQDFWRRCNIRRPERVSPGFENGVVNYRSGLLIFGHKKYCILDSSVAKGYVPTKIKVDAIYVAKGFKGDLSQWLANIETPIVILDNRLSDWWRNDFIAKCNAANCETYDLSCKPCLKMPL